MPVVYSLLYLLFLPAIDFDWSYIGPVFYCEPYFFLLQSLHLTIYVNRVIVRCEPVRITQAHYRLAGVAELWNRMGPSQEQQAKQVHGMSLAC